MPSVSRDFNTLIYEHGDITAYLSNNNKICINILHLHGIGQAWMYVKYPLNMDMYTIILTIFDKLTIDIFQQKLERGKAVGAYPIDISNGICITPEYKDIVILDEDMSVDNMSYSVFLGNYISFTRESVELLEEYENDRDEEDKYPGLYIVKGEILENGEFIYDTPIKSNNYDFHNYSDSDSECDNS